MLKAWHTGFEISNWMHLSIGQVDCKNNSFKCTNLLSVIFKANATYVKIRNTQSSVGQVLWVFHLSDCNFYSSQTIRRVKFRTLGIEQTQQDGTSFMRAPVLETRAGPSVRDRQLLVRTRNFLHISLQINVWISQNPDQDRQLFQLSPEHWRAPGFSSGFCPGYFIKLNPKSKFYDQCTVQVRYTEYPVISWHSHQDTYHDTEKLKKVRIVSV